MLNLSILGRVIGRLFGKLGAVIVTALAFVALLASLAMFLIERGHESGFDSFGDTLWWVVVTVSTVGYGDIAPATGLGRVVGAVVVIVGPIVFASGLGTVSFRIYDEWRKVKNGMSQVTFKGHLILAGWTQRGPDIIAELRSTDEFSKVAIVVIDNELDSRPLDDNRIHFIKGLPSDAAVLDRANAVASRAAIILAPDGGDPEEDYRTALRALALRAVNENLRISAELISLSNEQHLRNAGCDVIVHGRLVASRLLAQSVTMPGVTKVIDQLLDPGGPDLLFDAAGEGFDGVRFGDVADSIRRGSNGILIGIEREGQITLTPNKEVEIRAADRLVLVGVREER